MATPAVAAAVRVAAEFGYPSDDPHVVQRTNNIVVWLRPHDVIAKVGTDSNGFDGLVREHALGVELADGGSIAPPLVGTEPAIDGETHFLVTLWRRLADDRTIEVAPPDVASSLRRLHTELARSDTTLPSFRAGLRRARSVLADDREMSALDVSDRTLLRVAFDRLLSNLAGHTFTEQALHGEPHDGNLVSTDAGLRWIDLEAACRGPLEWDLAFLPNETVDLFPEAEPALLALLRSLNSARVATWCWRRVDVGDMRWHAEHHLERVRRDLNTAR
jgi:hypothetical protein